MKCLVVDPSPTMTRIIRNVLRAASAEEILCARTADEAVALVEKMKAPVLDLLVTERELDGASGLDLAAVLRSREGLDRLSAIVVSSRNSRRDVLEALEAGIDGYVLKPLDQEALLARAVAVLEARASQETGAGEAAGAPAGIPAVKPAARADADASGESAAPRADGGLETGSEPDADDRQAA